MSDITVAFLPELSKSSRGADCRSTGRIPLQVAPDVTTCYSVERTPVPNSTVRVPIVQGIHSYGTVLVLPGKSKFVMECEPSTCTDTT